MNTSYKPIQIGPSLFDFKRPYVMGILNVTPDSFSDGGKFSEVEEAEERALQMVAEGADILDIGGESTRPGSPPVSQEEELQRVVPVIRRLSGKISVPISIDTYKSEVAKIACKEGASLVNDISAMQFDPQMASVVAQLGVPIVLMHTRGRPDVMQKNVFYQNALEEVFSQLKEATQRAELAGIKKENVILDPGFGFGKRLEDNRELFRGIPTLLQLGCPLLVGISRKSCLGTITGEQTPKERLGASVAAAAIAVSLGACIIRAHDIKETVQAVKVASWIGPLQM